MNVNVYEIPPMESTERAFLLSKNVSPDLISLYEEIRNKILSYGKIQVWVTKNYLSFKHPYGRNEEKLGTLIDVIFKDDCLQLYFNMRNTMPSDPKNLLTPTKSLGSCNYYAIINKGDDLSNLDYLIQQAIYCVSHKHRIVRINNKFITI